MDFELIDTKVGTEEEQQTEEETYEDIQQGKTTPTISIEKALHARFGLLAGQTK